MVRFTALAIAAAAFAGLSTVQAATTIMGWGSQTTGGEVGGTVYHVTNRAELDAALLNNGNPGGPKKIYIKGEIYGDVSADGKNLTAQDYAPGWDQTAYIACFTDNGLTRVVSDQCTALEALRVAGQAAQEKRVVIKVPGNTSIIGSTKYGKIIGAALRIDSTSNVIIQNLYFEAPRDYFAEWDPTDTSKGAWNSEYDALAITTSTNVWVDHCEFTDGRFKNSQMGTPLGGQHIELHDGLLDITLSSDLITVSYNKFHDHDKTNLLGSSDSRTADAGKIRVTFYANYWKVLQRAPRVRYGQVHLFNNYYYANLNDTDYPMVAQSFGGPYYFIGVGFESQIYAEYNNFEYVASIKSPALNASVALYNWGGYAFNGPNNFFNKAAFNLTAVAEQKFKANVAARLASDAAANKTSPSWTTKSFALSNWVPSQAYTYSVIRKDYSSIKTLVQNYAGVNKVSTL